MACAKRPLVCLVVLLLLVLCLCPAGQRSGDWCIVGGYREAHGQSARMPLLLLMDGRAVLERYHWLGGMIAVSSVCLPSIIAVELVDQRCDATSAATAHWRERANRLVGMIQNLGGLFRTGALDVLKKKRRKKKTKDLVTPLSTPRTEARPSQSHMAQL
ncbi:hypothetical protein CI102_10408 [Trichoderma harzianum]|nr:hypothetical protein CI102_10408 [Trichoderma harzianum]